MKVDVDQHGNIRLTQVFNGIILETREGNQIGVSMRDDTVEINVLPKGVNTGNWWRVNMQTSCIASMKESSPESK